MPEDTKINSLKIELDTDDDVKTTGRYMEPKNDTIEVCLDQIDNTENQLLEQWRGSFHKTKSLSWTDGVGIIQWLKVQMCRKKHKAIDDKHKDESTSA